MSGSAQEMNKAFENSQELKEIEEDYRELQLFSKMSAPCSSAPDDSQADVLGILPTLSPKEQELMRCLYGLNGYKKHTYAETARRLGLPEARVRQMESKLRRKMKA